MPEERITIEGREYVSPVACSFGDYGGSGSVGLANIRAIVESVREQEGETFETFHQSVNRAGEDKQSPYALDDEIELRAAVRNGPPLAIHATGSHGSETIYILADSDLARETLESLARYPSLDDDSVSEIEMQWESEAWESWLRSDLERAARPTSEEPESEADAAAYEAMSDSDKWAACRHAMECENEYFESEYSSSYARVERFAARYRETIESMLKGETINSLARKRWPSAYGVKSEAAT